MLSRVAGPVLGFGFLSLSLVACSPKLASVKVDPATATLEAVDQTAQFKASEFDADGKPLKKAQPVTWTSDNAAVATVANDGTAKAKKSGHATLTAAVGTIKTTATVDVHIPAKVTGQDVTLAGMGKTQDVPFQVMDEDGQAIADMYSKIVVTVADPKVASVAGPSSGVWTFTAVGAGKTQVAVVAGPVNQSFNLTVSVPEVTELKLGQASLKLKVGAAEKITATALSAGQPVDGVPVNYSTSDAKVATVDPDGTVHAAGKGKATVTVTAGAKTANVTVTVKK